MWPTLNCLKQYNSPNQRSVPNIRKLTWNVAEKFSNMENSQSFGKHEVEMQPPLNCLTC